MLRAVIATTAAALVSILIANSTLTLARDLPEVLAQAETRARW